MLDKLAPVQTRERTRQRVRRRHLGLELLEGRITPSTLGVSALVESPSVGSDLDMVATSGAWSATANAAWLHTTSSGSGSGLATFTFDANPGATRNGTLTIAGETLTVTQAGSTYVAAQPLTTLASTAAPNAVAVDGSGNVYFSDGFSGAILKWNAATQQVVTLLTDPAIPTSLAVDGPGNVYFTEAGRDFIKVWNATNNVVSTLFSSPVLRSPSGVAVDGSGNVFIADNGNEAIMEWNASNHHVTTLFTTGLNEMKGVALDVAGNVYFAIQGTGDNFREWNSATQTITAFTYNEQAVPEGLAVDGSGNVYIADSNNNIIIKGNPFFSHITTLAPSGLNDPAGVAVDDSGNVYIADIGNSAIKELPRAFVPAGPFSETAAAGADQLLPVLPSTQSLTGVWAPSSDQSWLTIGSVANGVVHFSFTANTGLPRSGTITVLGQQITVNQAGKPTVTSPTDVSITSTTVTLGGNVTSNGGASLIKRGVLYAKTATNANPQLGGTGVTEVDDAAQTTGVFTENVTGLSAGTAYSFVAFATNSVGASYTSPVSTFITLPVLGASSLLEGPTAGSDSDLVVASGAWSATANAAWLHTTSSGSGNGLATFAFDANSGSTRSGTLTIAGQTLTVTQAGSTYVQANAVATLVSSPGLSSPSGVAVDGAGNVFIADTAHNAIKEWSPSTQLVTTLTSSPNVFSPTSLAVDGSGNVYFTQAGGNFIKEWNHSSHVVSTLISTDLAAPSGVAVDGSGNVYIADNGNEAIMEWNASTQLVTTLFTTGLDDMEGVALDGAGNVYVAVQGNNSTFWEWNSATHAIVNIFFNDQTVPEGLAVDGSGNVYIADSNHNAIKEANASTHQVITLAQSGLNDPAGVAVDSSGNVYFADSGNNAVKELPRAFVPTGTISETAAAGSDQLLPVIPSTQSLTGVFAPSSDQSWLTIGSVANGVVHFSFTANTGSSRAAHLTVLGRQITVNQAGLPTVTSPTDVSITSTTATLGGNVTSNGGASLTKRGVLFAKTATNANPQLGGPGVTEVDDAAQTTGVFTENVTGLSAGTGYSFVAFATNSVGTTYTSPVSTFSTLAAPTVTSPTDVSITSTTATLGGNVTSNGGASLTKRGVLFAKTATNANPQLGGPGVTEVDDAAQNIGIFAENVTGLSAGTGYSFVAFATNSVGTTYTSPVSTFSTLAAPTVTSPTDVSITSTTVTLGGNVTSNGGASLTERGVLFAKTATNANPQLGGPGVTEVDDAAQTTGVFTENVTGLSAGTGYSFVAFATNSVGTTYTSPVSTFSTWAAPTVTSPTDVSISSTTATLGGNVTSDGGTSLTKRGVLFAKTATNANPQLGGTGVTEVDDATQTTGVYTENITGLSTGTGYSFVAFATNSVGTTYTSPVSTFITLAGLAATSLFEGATAGADSDIVTITGAWSATANAAWLHTMSSGADNGLATFTFDANPGATRSGTLTIAGQTLTVTQAGSTYLADPSLTTLVSTGLSTPRGVAVDGSGNVYIANTGNHDLKEWNASTQLVTTLVGSGLGFPIGLAVDGTGNVYIADSDHITEWNASTHQVSTLVSGLGAASGVAVDGSGNVYIAHTAGTFAIEEWNASTHQVTTLVSTGPSSPARGVAVDGSGNVYFADFSDNTIKEWNATTHLVSTVVSSGLSSPYGVAVDGSGNLYIADNGNNTIEEWNASTHLVTTLVSSGLSSPFGVAVDGSGNVYLTDTGHNAIEELPRAFVPAAPIGETAAAGADQLLPVLPTTQSLTGVFAPSSDQSWLTIGSVANGVIHFAFTDNDTGASRTAHLTVLGQQITVTQAPPLGTGSLLEGPGAGSDSDIVTFTGAWSATANAAWLHTTSSGADNGLATFTFDANPGATRSGTLTIAGQTLTVTQAGSAYVAVNPLTTLASSDRPASIAVDGSGNVYFADLINQTINEWNASTQMVSTLVSEGVGAPSGLAVDGLGNLYFAESTFNGSIKKWNASTQQVSTLVSTGLAFPGGVAVDGSGNVYIADTHHNAIEEWNASTQLVSTLVSTGLSFPSAVAVDESGNVYIANGSPSAIKKWNASTHLVTTLATGLGDVEGMAVDGSGNVYTVNYEDSAIMKWDASTQVLSTLVGSGLNFPIDVAVDASGNVYIADSLSQAIKELPRAFLPAGPIGETAVAGTDQLLPVLPTNQSLTGIFAPSSDQSWLTTGSSFDGVIPFGFADNDTGASRTANLTVLGKQIAVTQDQAGTFLSLNQADVASPVYGQSLILTAFITGNIDGFPTGTVTFFNGATVIDSASLSTLNGVTSASITTSALPAGSDSLSATFSGDTEFSGSTGYLTQTITPAILTVTANDATRVYGAANPTFSDTVTGFVNSDPDSVVSGAASLTTTATSSSGAGSYPITAALGSLQAANYSFVFVAGALTVYTPVAPVQVSVGALIRNSPAGSAASGITVVFNASVDLATFTASALTLTRNGAIVAITTPISVQQGGNATTYLISGPDSYTTLDGAYSLSVDASQLADTGGHQGAGTASISWLMDATLPTSTVSRLATTQLGLSFPVSVTGSDPVPANGSTPSGVAGYDLYVSTDGTHWSFWTAVSAASPAATFTGASNTSYGFYSVSHDVAGNVQAFAPHVEASTYEPDYTPPSIHVASVNSATAAFTVNWQGTASGGSGLSRVDLYVQVDGGAVQAFAQAMPGSPVSGIYSGAASYQALSDGLSHTYRFYSLGTNGNGIQQSAPATADASVAVAFAPPVSLQVTTFSVEKGISERSYIRYLTIGFNDATQLANWYALGKLSLQQFDLNDANPQTLTLAAGMVSISGTTMTIDFGTGGITGLAPLNGASSTTTGDGYYSLSFDLDGSGHFATIKNFYRLLGDVNGDGLVNTTDTNAITAALGQSGALLNADVNGDGAVNANDRTYATRSLNRRLNNGLPMELANGHATRGQLVPIAVQDVQALLPAARAAWQRAGLNAAGVKLLEQATIQVTNLPHGFLALTAGSQIRIDGAAQAQGWFVDATPATNSEFRQLGSGPSMAALPGGPADGGIDLLTVLIHELGHMLGIGETDEVLLPGHVTNEDLMPGIRELPVAADVPAAFLRGTQTNDTTAYPALFIAGTDRNPASPAATMVLGPSDERLDSRSSISMAERPAIQASVSSPGRVIPHTQKIVDALFEEFADDLD